MTLKTDEENIISLFHRKLCLRPLVWDLYYFNPNSNQDAAAWELKSMNLILLIDKQWIFDNDLHHSG